mgnify:CR=1 FL=1
MGATQFPILAAVASHPAEFAEAVNSDRGKVLLRDVGLSPSEVAGLQLPPFFVGARTPVHVWNDEIENDVK